MNVPPWIVLCVFRLAEITTVHCVYTTPTYMYSKALITTFISKLVHASRVSILISLFRSSGHYGAMD